MFLRVFLIGLVVSNSSSEDISITSLDVANGRYCPRVAESGWTGVDDVVLLRMTGIVGTYRCVLQWPFYSFFLTQR